MSSGAVKSRTAFLGLAVLNFNFPNWGDDANTNVKILDAAFSILGLSVSGAWATSTAYTAGDLVVDVDSNTLWRCQVTHTSAASGTFAEDRAAHPTYWAAYTTTVSWRGQWLTATSYFTNEIVFDGYVYAIATQSFISGANLATDIAGGKFVPIVDGTTIVNAATAAKNAAETAETNAETAATTATTQAGIATTQAGNASTSAGTATTQAGIATTQAGIATTQASNSASSAVAAGNAQVAAEAARDQTLALFDNFDDRYLGAKAADPTLDNDGNALVAGSLYFNSVDGIMKVYTGTIWVAAYVSGTDFAARANNGSDFTDFAQFRTNLSLYSTSQVYTKTEVDNFAVKLTGDQSISGIKTFSSAPAVPNSSFTLAKLANGTALSLIGRSANSAGVYADIVAGADGDILRRSGTTIGFGTILAASISNFNTAADARVSAAIGSTVQAYDAQLSSLIRQNSQSAAYTCVLADGGKHILHPSADTTARIFTIPANSSVAYPIGTAITFVNQNAAGVITIAITTDTMRLAGAGTTGSRTLAANGIATALKITATEWIISGTGLT